jgi:ABC-type uncharacterized transport system permease subunit
MILRMLGVAILVGALLGALMAVAALRAAPERIRDVSLASLFTGSGMAGVGLGLAFGSGPARIVLVIGGIAAYLYGLGLGYVRKWRRAESEAP